MLYRNSESRPEHLLVADKLRLVQYISEGIDRNTVQENLVMEMRTCASAGLSDFAYDLPSLDTITLLDLELM